MQVSEKDLQFFRTCVGFVQVADAEHDKSSRIIVVVSVSQSNYSK